MDDVTSVNCNELLTRLAARVDELTEALNTARSEAERAAQYGGSASPRAKEKRSAVYNLEIRLDEVKNLIRVVEAELQRLARAALTGELATAGPTASNIQ
jgi:chromosome segregation ATPase